MTATLKVQVNAHGCPVSVYSFRPTSNRAAARLRRLFPRATWSGGSMYAEHRYAPEAALVLEGEGVILTREGDDRPLTLNGRTFVFKRSE